MKWPCRTRRRLLIAGRPLWRASRSHSFTEHALKPYCGVTSKQPSHANWLEECPHQSVTIVALPFLLGCVIVHVECPRFFSYIFAAPDVTSWPESQFNLLCLARRRLSQLRRVSYLRCARSDAPQFQPMPSKRCIVIKRAWQVAQGRDHLGPGFQHQALSGARRRIARRLT